MSDIPYLEKYGKAIGEAADNGDVEAKEIIRWYTTSRNIKDSFGISLAELKAKEWAKEQPTKSSEAGDG